MAELLRLRAVSDVNLRGIRSADLHHLQLHIARDHPVLHPRHQRITTMNIDLLNQVQQMLIDHANTNGLDLSDDFSSPVEFKKLVIGFTFKGLLDAGATAEEAYDAIFGEGEYDALYIRVTAS